MRYNTLGSTLRPADSDGPGRQTGSIVGALILIVIASIVVLLMPARANATVYISDDYGGYVAGYEAKWAAVRASGENVVIDGPCVSACTMVLGIVPPERICVTPRAILAFHAVRRAFLGGEEISGEGTQRLLAMYPPHIQQWIAANGGLQEDLIILNGPELLHMYPNCHMTRIARAR